MSRPQTRSVVRELLDRHGVSPTKRLGQNFLVDPNIVGKIVRLVEAPPGSSIVEIGAGTGTLTLGLAAAGFRVQAYEIDETLRPVLADALTDQPGIEVRFEDVTDVSLADQLEGGPWWMVANLPYNVGTPILLDALRTVPQIAGFVVMVQREVADRLLAQVGEPEYGVPSVIVQLFGSATSGFLVPPQVFIPKPHVDSAVVVIRRLHDPSDSMRGRAVELAQTAFNQRRKMVRTSLRAVLDDPERPLREAGIGATLRAEDLAPDDYLRLAEVVS